MKKTTQFSKNVRFAKFCAFFSFLFMMGILFCWDTYVDQRRKPKYHREQQERLLQSKSRRQSDDNQRRNLSTNTNSMPVEPHSKDYSSTFDSVHIGLKPIKSSRMVRAEIQQSPGIESGSPHQVGEQSGGVEEESVTSAPNSVRENIECSLVLKS